MLSGFLRTFPVFRRHRFLHGFVRTFPSQRYQIADFNDGSKAVVDCLDDEGRNVYLKKRFEPEFFRIAEALMPPHGTFFDIGANFGLCSFGLMNLVRATDKGSVHMFEANPQLLPLLKRSAGLQRPNCFNIVGGAVTEDSGYSFLSVNPERLGESFLTGETPGSPSVKVPNVVLDGYIAQNKISRVHFAKMDIEGNELAALKGAKTALQQGIFEAIYIEVSSLNLGRHEISPAELIGFLEEVGFECWWCKSSDRQLWEPRGLEEKHLQLREKEIHLAKLFIADFPNSYQTDILAIHRSCRKFIL